MSQQAMRVFSTAFKESAVLRLGAGERLAEVARELGSRASCSTSGGRPIGSSAWRD